MTKKLSCGECNQEAVMAIMGEGAIVHYCWNHSPLENYSASFVYRPPKSTPEEEEEFRARQKELLSSPPTRTHVPHQFILWDGNGNEQGRKCCSCIYEEEDHGLTDLSGGKWLQNLRSKE